MSTGGIFKLITNDGKQDRMLMATELLNQRLRDIEMMRSKNPNIRDPTPTLVDIERTHILFMNAHFKPFAAIGYEYNSIRTQSGNAAFGSQAQFSIPQFGDFFNDMVLHVKVDAVDADGTLTLADGAAPVDKRTVRYCEFPGQKLLTKVAMEVNGNPLDKYGSEEMAFHQKFLVQPNKEVGWNRNVGQEDVLVGYTSAATADYRERKSVCSGPQTPKSTQPELEMWIPLLFWFNKDPRLSIPSVSIPYGQRFITVDFAAAAELLSQPDGTVPSTLPSINTAELYINNIFVNPEIHDIFIKRIGFTLIRVHRKQIQKVNKATDNILFQQLKWPVETLYLGIRLDSNLKTTGATDDRRLENWHRFGDVTDTVIDSCAADCQAYSWGDLGNDDVVSAAELDAAFQPVDGNVAQIDFAGNVATPLQPPVSEINSYLESLGYHPLVGTFGTVATPTRAEIIAASPNLCCEVRVKECAPTVDTLKIEAHGIPLYRTTPAQFFNSYVPYTYGGHHVRTPDDCGALMVTFNLYPGSYQPSGHVNLSRAREFYIEYVSSVISSSVTGELCVVGVAINFLLISDGSAVLRYST